MVRERRPAATLLAEFLGGRERSSRLASPSWR